ncbi:MAG: hypothetical protein ACLU9T_11725 [Blautia faecis]
METTKSIGEGEAGHGFLVHMMYLSGCELIKLHEPLKIIESDQKVARMANCNE